MNAEQEAVTVARVRSWLRSGRARAIRQRAGISQAEVARAVGTDHAQISRWESGSPAPHRDSALKLARLYDRMEKIIRDENAAARLEKTAGAA
jgi:transcriptional regulator with XRE-family HTH domain